MTDLDKLTARIKDFPTLPTIYTKLMKTMSDPNSTIKEVADIISSDQSTSIKVLKFANSPIFAIQKQVQNISDAIFYVGFNEIKNIVLALSVMKLFENTKPTLHFNIVDFWKHSIGTGVIARFIGMKIMEKNIEDYFISGILHDIGKLFMLRVFDEKYIKIIDYSIEEGYHLSELEKKIFGFTHTFAGGLIADKWKLPVSIRNSIKRHHSCFVDGSLNTQTSCVHIANIVAQVLSLGTNENELIDEPVFDVWNMFDFESDFFTSNYQTIINNYQQSIQILSL